MKAFIRLLIISSVIFLLCFQVQAATGPKEKVWDITIPLSSVSESGMGSEVSGFIIPHGSAVVDLGGVTYAAISGISYFESEDEQSGITNVFDMTRYSPDYDFFTLQLDDVEVLSAITPALLTGTTITVFVEGTWINDGEHWEREYLIFERALSGDTPIPVHWFSDAHYQRIGIIAGSTAYAICSAKMIGKKAKPGDLEKIKDFSLGQKAYPMNANSGVSTFDIPQGTQRLVITYAGTAGIAYVAWDGSTPTVEGATAIGSGQLTDIILEIENVTDDLVKGSADGGVTVFVDARARKKY